jgi:hypothetical protein
MMDSTNEGLRNKIKSKKVYESEKRSERYCIFSLENLTTSQTTTMTTPNRLHNNTTVTDATADWILEHSLPGTDLANYGLTMVFDTIAHPNNSTLTIPYSGNTNVQFKMVNGNDTLSTVTPTHLCLFV